ncbi:MAG: 1-deoxy-D-xylulose-5-phosphate reductoisomerase [Planctomycetota bacterium]
MVRRIAVLGCTGSVGVNALDILRRHPDRFEVSALVANRSADALAAQCAEHSPKAACLVGGGARPATLPTGSEWFEGEAGLIECLDSTDPDLVLNAITGAAGLPVTEWALRNGKTLALANKESLVMAGEYLMPLAQRTGATILPVDSEHCALFQCFNGEPRERLRRIWLTASGGPFRTRDASTFGAITPAEALKHPTWDMGPRITIGSATLMNKGFEILEAHWLFGLKEDEIEVLVHPQSIVHSMVEFCDGSILAQLGVPDMRVPILYCLSWPDRLPFGDFEPFHPQKFAELNFEPVDRQKFPTVDLAFECLRRGGDSGAVLNAADEVLTQAFLDGEVAFPDIPALVAEVLRSRDPRPIASLDDVRAADREAREAARAAIAAR